MIILLIICATIVLVMYLDLERNKPKTKITKRPKEGDILYEWKTAILPIMIEGKLIWMGKYAVEFTYSYKWEKREDVVKSGLFTETVQVSHNNVGRFRITKKYLPKVKTNN